MRKQEQTHKGNFVTSWPTELEFPVVFVISRLYFLLSVLVESLTSCENSPFLECISVEYTKPTVFLLLKFFILLDDIYN